MGNYRNSSSLENENELKLRHKSSFLLINDILLLTSLTSL